MQELDKIVDAAIEADAPHGDKFQITDDKTAGWALRKIKQMRDNHTRFIKACNERKETLLTAVAEIDDRIRKNQNELVFEEQRFIDMLDAFTATVPTEFIKRSKTQHSYKLPEGKIVRKLPKLVYKHDDELLLKSLKTHGMFEMIKAVESPKWAEIKADITSDGKYADPVTGEVLDLEGIETEWVDGRLEVEV